MGFALSHFGGSGCMKRTQDLKLLKKPSTTELCLWDLLSDRALAKGFGFTHQLKTKVSLMLNIR